MCFDTSMADWYSDVQRDTTGVSIFPARCDECGLKILSYEWRRHIEQQEHEECQRCEFEELEPGEEPCENHDYGEFYSYDRCESCDKLLKVIDAMEASEGCPINERQPLLGDLREELYQHDRAGEYAARAIETHPELASVEWIVDLLAVESHD